MTEDQNALGLQNINVSFAVYNAEEFTNASTISTGVSVFLYRLLPNLSHRTPAGRMLPDGRRQRTQLPLDLHLLLTAWASKPETQNQLAGWLMRTLEDYPTLPASVLNHKYPNTFTPDEAVEIIVSEMTLDNLLALWERLSDNQTPYQISIPYVARAVLIESQREAAYGAPVKIRTQDVQRLEHDT